MPRPKKKQKPGPKKGGPNQSPGRPCHAPDEESRAFVTASVAAGTPQAEVAACLDISSQTLRLHYNLEIRLAKQRLLNKAIGVLDQHLEESSLDAAKFTLARRGGWSEKHDLMSSDGSMTPRDLSQEMGQAVLEAVKRKHAKP